MVYTYLYIRADNRLQVVTCQVSWPTPTWHAADRTVQHWKTWNHNLTWWQQTR